MTNKRVADVLVETLVAAGVKNICGPAGDTLNGITDLNQPRHGNPPSGKILSAALISNLLEVSADNLLRKEGQPCNSAI
jgi:hypothetical protein